MCDARTDLLRFVVCVRVVLRISVHMYLDMIAIVPIIFIVNEWFVSPHSASQAINWLCWRLGQWSKFKMEFRYIHRYQYVVWFSLTDRELMGPSKCLFYHQHNNYSEIVKWWYTHTHITSCVRNSCCHVRNLSLDIEIENQLFRRGERKNELIKRRSHVPTHTRPKPNNCL